MCLLLLNVDGPRITVCLLCAGGVGSKGDFLAGVGSGQTWVGCCLVFSLHGLGRLLVICWTFGWVTGFHCLWLKTGMFYGFTFWVVGLSLFCWILVVFHVFGTGMHDGLVSIALHVLGGVMGM